VRAPWKRKIARGRRWIRLTEIHDQDEWPRPRGGAQTVPMAEAGCETAEIAGITPKIEWLLREAPGKSPCDRGPAQPGRRAMLSSKVIKRRRKCAVSDESIRQQLHGADGVCLRPAPPSSRPGMGTVRQGAEAQPRRAPKMGNFRPRRHPPRGMEVYFEEELN